MKMTTENQTTQEKEEEQEQEHEKRNRKKEWKIFIILLNGQNLNSLNRLVYEAIYIWQWQALYCWGAYPTVRPNQNKNQTK